MTDKSDQANNRVGSGLDAKGDPNRFDSGAGRERPDLAAVDQRLQESCLSPNALDQTDESQKAADITSGNSRAR